MVQIQGISKFFGEQKLFQDVSFLIQPGERIGLTGRNGTGKSTLFRIMLGQEPLDSGSIQYPKHYSLGHLEQHIHFTHSTVLDEACSALRPNEDGWIETHKAEAVLFGLGFQQDDLQKPPSQLSGGFQIRLNLTKVLIAEPHLLLLDEPTNYLDIVSVRWLEKFLCSWKGEILLITHDRAFMNAVCTHVVGIHRQQMRKIQGSVEKWQQTILLEEEVHLKTLANEAKKREQQEIFIQRFRAQATRAKAVQSRVKALARKEPLQKLQQIKDLDFRFQEAPFPGKRLMQVESVLFGYSSAEPLIQDFSMEIFKGDRIAVVGPNGKGKTTLLNLMAQELQPQRGLITYNPNVAVGYFGQTNIERLNPELSVEQEIESTLPDITRGKARNLAGLMMFEGDAALKPIRVLSGGERSRVMLAKILGSPTNLLFLDEPTNHLDMQSIDSLVEAIEIYAGTLIFVSHDEELLHSLANRLIVFDRDEIKVFEGSYQEFLDRVGWSHETQSASSSVANPSHRSKISRQERAQKVQERSRLLKPILKKLKQTETQLEALEQDIPQLEEKLAQASTEGKAEMIAPLAQQLEKNKKQAEDLFKIWEDLQTQKDSIEARFELE